jgi:tetratricopeptide (TPR) repeat protein
MSLKNTIPTNNKKEIILLLFFVIILTIIVFSPVFKAGFVNWDDDQYVVKNENIKSIENIWKYSMEPVAGYFHPFTLLTMSLDNWISKGNPHWFHIVNLFIHIINIVLVFFFIYKLSEKRKWVAITTALLFAIHPLHVESVAWISERKDLLYTLFFMGGLIVYINYLKKNSLTALMFVFVLFLFSLLSKPAAVVFPIVLLAVDFYFNRLNQRRTYLEKIPFFLMSIFLAFITLQAQKTAGAILNDVLFPLTSRFFIGNYGVMMYLVKMVFPFNLCAFYPYPAVNLALPWVYYLSFLFTVALIVLFFVSIKRNKEISFAILFYIINLILVLQFFSVGSAVISDRYSYVPLIGPFFIIGLYIQRLFDLYKGKISPLAGTIAVIVILSLVVISRNQASTWENGVTLWDQAIKACPSSTAYSNRGSLYKAEGKTEEALAMYSKAIGLDKFETDALINRANILFSQKQYVKAIRDYSQCILVEPRNDKAYSNRGAAYLSIGKIDSALIDLNLSIEINPKAPNGYKNRGMLFLMTKQYQNAIRDYSKQLEIVPDTNGETWNKIGYCYQQIGNHQKAIIAFNKGIELSHQGNFYYLRAISLNALGENKLAREDAKRAMALGVKIDQEFLKSLGL